MKLFFTLLASFLLCFSLYAQDIKGEKHTFTNEIKLQKIYDSTITKHFDKHKLQYFSTKDSLQIAYKLFDVVNAKAIIVISSGRTESMIKYQELIYDFNQNGYSVYIFDHRGQGYSSRILKDSQIGHVDNFFDYVLDLKQFVDTIISKDKKMILLGHSMGGTVASLYVETYKNDFDGLVLVSPMHQPKILNNFLSNLSCGFIQNRKSNLDKYTFGTGSFDESEHKFKKNIFTHSKLRFELTNEAYEKAPQTKIGGPSLGWLAQACLWSKKSVKNAKEIKIPTLLLQADKDKVVNLKAQDEFCTEVGKICTLKNIDESFHEILMEKDNIREKALNDILDFISKI